MKKYLSFLFLISLLALAIPVAGLASECAIPNATTNTPIVRCGLDASCPCDFLDFFKMLARIYNFIVFTIATPLAVLAFSVGGIMLMASAGNPNLSGMAKKIMWAAAMGSAVVFCSYLIINFIMEALGYKGSWWQI